jgi:hypothetical protein
MGRILIRVALAGLLSVLVAAPAAAAGATNTTIEITGIAGVETFTTTGGLLCPDGTSENFFENFGGSPFSHAGTFHGYKTLTCNDGSGTFSITYDAGTVWGSPQDQGGWKVIGGTDDYASLQGGGNLVGTYTDDGIIDLYTGRVSL